MGKRELKKKKYREKWLKEVLTSEIRGKILKAHEWLSSDKAKDDNQFLSALLVYESLVDELKHRGGNEPLLKCNADIVENIFEDK